MPMLLEEEYEYKLPLMHTITQEFDATCLAEYGKTLREQLEKPEIIKKIKPGMKVAVAVGSRGINHVYDIIKKTIDFLLELGVKPYIVSAMGSHGGGNEEGQRAVLASFGITSENLGIEVVTSTDVVSLGYLQSGEEVFFDKAAMEADMIVPINRVKLHTDFVGPIQSGLCKMLVIGLGNQKGCSKVHETAPKDFAKRIEDTAMHIINRAPIGFGIAVMENAYDETCHIEAIPSENMISREKELVKKCPELMPYIGIKEADIIVVEEIGKDISGAGYDPNILGRSNMLTSFVLPVPKFQRMVLLGVTEKSHGNAIGMGFFDVITKNVLDGIDYESIYANAIAVKSLEDAKIPLVAKDEDEAIRVAVKTCRNIDVNRLKIIKIKNTLELSKIQISQTLFEEYTSNLNK